jgi:hypothetical protein
LSGIVTQLFTSAEKAIADGSPTADGNPSVTIFLNQSDALSLMRTPEERDPSPQGAFLLAANGVIHLASTVFGDVDVDFEVAAPFVWKLLDGRLTVDPLRDVGAGSSPFLSGLSGAVGQLLGTQLEATLDEFLLPELSQPVFPFSAPKTLAETVYQTADQTQVFSGIPGTTCTPQAPDNPRIPAVSDPVSGLPLTLCGGKNGFFDNLHTNLQNALKPGHFGNFVGVPATAFDQMWHDTILARAPSGSFYENVRCAPSTVGSNTCQLVLPARRINPFPDGIELVFVDDDKEYNNPAFPVWLVLGDAADKTLLAKLCDPPRQASVDSSGAVSLAPRPYAHATLDAKRFSAVNCATLTTTPTTTYDCQIQVQ